MSITFFLHLLHCLLLCFQLFLFFYSLCFIAQCSENSLYTQTKNSLPLITYILAAQNLTEWEKNKNVISENNNINIECQSIQNVLTHKAIGFREEKGSSNEISCHRSYLKDSKVLQKINENFESLRQLSKAKHELKKNNKKTESIKLEDKKSNFFDESHIGSTISTFPYDQKFYEASMNSSKVLEETRLPVFDQIFYKMIKNPEMCTFAPKATLYKSINNKNKVQINNNSYDKTIDSINNNESSNDLNLCETFLNQDSLLEYYGVNKIPFLNKVGLLTQQTISNETAEKVGASSAFLNSTEEKELLNEVKGFQEKLNVDLMTKITLENNQDFQHYNLRESIDEYMELSKPGKIVNEQNKLLKKMKMPFPLIPPDGTGYVPEPTLPLSAYPHEIRCPIGWISVGPHCVTIINVPPYTTCPGDKKEFRKGIRNKITAVEAGICALNSVSGVIFDCPKGYTLSMSYIPQHGKTKGDSSLNVETHKHHEENQLGRAIKCVGYDFIPYSLLDGNHCPLGYMPSIEGCKAEQMVPPSIKCPPGFILMSEAVSEYAFRSKEYAKCGSRVLYRGKVWCPRGFTPHLVPYPEMDFGEIIPDDGEGKEEEEIKLQGVLEENEDDFNEKNESDYIETKQSSNLNLKRKLKDDGSLRFKNKFKNKKKEKFEAQKRNLNFDNEEMYLPAIMRDLLQIQDMNLKDSYDNNLFIKDKKKEFIQEEQERQKKNKREKNQKLKKKKKAEKKKTEEEEKENYLLNDSEEILIYHTAFEEDIKNEFISNTDDSHERRHEISNNQTNRFFLHKEKKLKKQESEKMFSDIHRRLQQDDKKEENIDSYIYEANPEKLSLLKLNSIIPLTTSCIQFVAVFAANCSTYECKSPYMSMLEKIIKDWLYLTLEINDNEVQKIIPNGKDIRFTERN